MALGDNTVVSTRWELGIYFAFVTCYQTAYHAWKQNIVLPAQVSDTRTLSFFNLYFFAGVCCHNTDQDNERMTINHESLFKQAGTFNRITYE